MKFLTVVFLISCLSTLSQAQIVLTEIMFDPSGPEASDEFIEILNIGEAPVDLQGFSVGDGDRTEGIVFPDSLSTLAPNQFAVIFDSDYFSSNRGYDALIPENALILAVDDKTLGSAGLSNSRAELVLLLNAAGDTLASYTYSIGNSSGRSDEKIEPANGDDAGNWADSKILLGTPGAKNSVSPSLFDLELASSQLKITPPIPRSGQTVKFGFTVENRGKQSVEQSNFALFREDALAIFSTSVPALSAGARFEFETMWTPEKAGIQQFKAEIFLGADENLSNNSFAFSLPVAWPERSLLINEIMYNPGTGEPEWVEILNPGAEAVPINDWRIQDASRKTGIVQEDNSVTIAPGGFAVLTNDLLVREFYNIDAATTVLRPVGFPTLNNTSEEILLQDFTGAQIDSIVYPEIGKTEKGVSLERIWETDASLDRTNWASSQHPAGATPGSMNSVSPLNFDLAIDSSSIVWQPDLPLRDDEIFLRFEVKNPGRQEAELASVRLFLDTDLNREFTPAEEIAGFSLAKILLSRDQRSESISWIADRSGFNLFRLEITAEKDQRTSNNAHVFALSVGFLIGDLLINEIMASPADGAPEWIEVINQAQTTVDLFGWRVGDGVAFSAPISEHVFLAPGDFAVLSDGQLSEVDDEVVISKFPNLNNNDDAARLLDLQDNLIDSVTWSETLAGVSLERINPKLPSDDPANWQHSVSPSGATPGGTNSVFLDVLPQTNKLSAAPNPFSPDADGIDDHTVISFELSLSESLVNLRIFDLYGREVRKLLNNAPAAAKRRVIWDGKADDGRVLDMGIYVVLLEAINAGLGRLEKARTTVVVAKKL